MDGSSPGFLEGPFRWTNPCYILVGFTLISLFPYTSFPWHTQWKATGIIPENIPGHDQASSVCRSYSRIVPSSNWRSVTVVAVSLWNVPPQTGFDQSNRIATNRLEILLEFSYRKDCCELFGLLTRLFFNRVITIRNIIDIYDWKYYGLFWSWEILLELYWNYYEFVFSFFNYITRFEILWRFEYRGIVGIIKIISKFFNQPTWVEISWGSRFCEMSWNYIYIIIIISNYIVLAVNSEVALFISLLSLFFFFRYSLVKLFGRKKLFCQESLTPSFRNVCEIMCFPWMKRYRRQLAMLTRTECSRCVSVRVNFSMAHIYALRFCIYLSVNNLMTYCIHVLYARSLFYEFKFFKGIYIYIIIYIYIYIVSA